MKQVMNYHKDNGLLNMIRRTDPMIIGSIRQDKTFPTYGASFSLFDILPTSFASTIYWGGFRLYNIIF